MGANLDVTDKDVICCPLPLYHCFGMVVGNLMGLNFGCPVVLPSINGFDPKETLEAISEHSATAVFAVPTMYIAMIEELHKNKDKYKLGSLRTGLTGGSQCTEALMLRINKEFGVKGFTPAYGLTETSPAITYGGMDDPISLKCNTVGRIGAGVEGKIVDPNSGDTLPFGETGELWVRGYLTMKGYWEDEERTKETITPDGWLKTGDIGTLDEEGYFRIIGRSKDLIIRSGENVYPVEVEEFYM